jgi:hypothetical protein
MIKPIVEKQRERQQRGEDFQDEIRRSWRLIPRTWRMRIPDGKGGTRPADELTLTEKVNILAEMKRTEGERFELDFLEPNQIKGLLDFDNVIERNYGLVYVSFLNEEVHRDTAYAFRLVAAIRFMQQKKRKYISLEELSEGVIPRIWLPRIAAEKMDDGKPGYNLKEVANCYKSL